MTDITIIGAGLSGTLVAVNLLKKQTLRDSVSIKLVDPHGKEDLGPAYSTNGDYLLNVPARLMGAISGPEHFYRWLEEKMIPVKENDFVPRKIFRKYIFELFDDALNKKNPDIQFERIQDEAIDIEILNGKANVFLKYGRNTVADKVVLALGNFAPPNPVTNNLAYLNSPLYYANPWKTDLFSNLSQDASIFFIGTGQTTVDLAAGLYRQAHKGMIFAISRRGLLPMPHNRFDVYPQFYDELRNQKSVLEIFKIVRRHIGEAEKSELDIRSVIDSLRPYTQELWLNLPAEEKQRFLRHLFRYWEIIRSRIPPETDNTIKQMQNSGQLKIIAGRITQLTSNGNSIDVHYTKRGNAIQKIQSASVVINCMGPELDYNKIDNPLVKNLLSRGLIQSDQVNIGLNAVPSGAVINKDGIVSDILYALGMPLRGILWEDVAVPDIRVHSYNLSELLLENKN